MIDVEILTSHDRVELHDCDRKDQQVYAEANILEYGVIHVKQRQILVFRQPQAASYQIKQVLEVTDTSCPCCFPRDRDRAI
jgi:Uma2 family endonuclease